MKKHTQILQKNTKLFFWVILTGFLFLLQTTVQAQTTINLPDCNGCDAAVTALDCASATFNNNEFTTGEEFQAAMTVPYTGGNAQPVTAVSVASTGVTGLTADLVSMDLATGAGSLIFYVHGTPSGAGTASFAITFGGQTCTADLVLTEVTPTGGVQTSFANSKACPLMLNIKDFGHNQNTIVPGENVQLFVTENGEIWGHGTNANRMMGYPTALTEDIPENTYTRPSMGFVHSPSPVAAIYAAGINKVWKDVQYVTDNGAYALAEDNTLWVWGGSATATPPDASTTAWNRPQHSIIPAGQKPYNAWQIMPPAGVAGFTQIITGDNRIVLARGTDGLLYSWGRGSQNQFANTTTGGGTVAVNVPTRADLIPQQILDNKNAIAPAFTSTSGFCYIDSNGDTYNYGTNLHATGATFSPVQITFPTAGVKAVKLTGGKGNGGYLMALGDDDKLYFTTTSNNTTTHYPSAFLRGEYNITPTSNPVNGWVEMDPEGSGGTYLDVSIGVSYSGIHGMAISSNGDVTIFSMVATSGTATKSYTGLNIEKVTGDQQRSFYMQSADGLTYIYHGTAATNTIGYSEHGQENSVGFDSGNSPYTGGPYLMNCYVNPADINNVTGN